MVLIEHRRKCPCSHHFFTGEDTSSFCHIKFNKKDVGHKVFAAKLAEYIKHGRIKESFGLYYCLIL